MASEKGSGESMETQSETGERRQKYSGLGAKTMFDTFFLERRMVKLRLNATSLLKKLGAEFSM